MKPRTPRIISPLLLGAIIVLSGCSQPPPPEPTPGVFAESPNENLQPAVATQVHLPAAPSELSGTYKLYFEDEFIMEIPFTGWKNTEFLQKDGSYQTAPALIFTWQVPGHHPWRIAVGHHENGTVAGLQLTCVGSAESNDAADRCPRNSPSDYDVQVPGAIGQPGLFGASWAIGRTWESTDGTNWTSLGPDSATMQATIGESSDGSACIAMSVDSSLAGRWGGHILAPTRGHVTMCETSPLPMRVQYGDYALVLREATTDGAQQWSAAKPVHTPSLPDQCTADLPQNGPDYLPSDQYWDWAIDNDDYIRAWLEAHPDGYLMPAVGHRAPSLSSPSPSLLDTYPILSYASLFDPATQNVQPVTIKSTWTRAAIDHSPFDENTFEPSRDLADAAQATAGPAGCPHNYQLAKATDPLAAALPDGYERWTSFMAPQLGKVWQGGSPWLWSMMGIEDDLGHAGFQARAIWQGDAWPPLAHMGYVPGGEGLGFLVFGAVEPATGDILWLELDGPV